MKTLTKVIAMLCIGSFASPVLADIGVTIVNNTKDYVFYLNNDPTKSIESGHSETISLVDHITMQMGMDSSSTPSPWKYNGLGVWGLAYSVDPVSGQGNFTVSATGSQVDPSSIKTPVPSFETAGGVTISGQDDWVAGVKVDGHGRPTDPITITISE